MKKNKILVSWIGHTDLLSMALDLNDGQKKEVLQLLHRENLEITGKGPIKTLTDAEKFDEIHLLSNYDEKLEQLLKKWLGCNPTIHSVKLSDPTNYEHVFEISNNILAQLVNGHKHNLELCIHLSPGTPTMTAIWVLLGKSRYPATFYQTYQSKFWKTNIPFDLVLDYVPDVLKDPDLHLQHLASKLPQDVEGFEHIIGASQNIRLAVGRAQRAALRDVPVLLLGETGTGKELFARAIHFASHRKKGPFVVLNCAAIPKDLLESELFGHKKGAFTGSIADRNGAFKVADGGTLFLDEIGDCELSIQVKLLRLLEPPSGAGPCTREFLPVGSNKVERSDVRVIGATNRDLLAEVKASRFREDLYYRLAVITIKLPPLRDRKSDISAIAEALLEQINTQFSVREPGYKDKKLSDTTKEFVKFCNWPGNVRQLYNVLLQASVMAEGVVLQKHDILAAISEMPEKESENILELPLGGDFSLDQLLQRIQRYYLERAMKEADGIKSKAAALLGIRNYQTLDAQLRRLGVKL